jgi:pseudoazurin
MMTKMNRLRGALTLAFVLAGAGNALSADHEVRMLNKGTKGGVMVFEPALIHAAVGDTVRFLPTDKGHNAESIKGMIPEGAEAFKGPLGREVSATILEDGVYGVRCAPHYGMGMVALIVVGKPPNLEAALAVRHPGKAKTVFASLFGQVVAAK